jgi:hypothetical protein
MLGIELDSLVVGLNRQSHLRAFAKVIVRISSGVIGWHVLGMDANSLVVGLNRKFIFAKAIVSIASGGIKFSFGNY